MPQHPRFSDDPAEDFKRLDSLAIMLRDYGLMHDDMLLATCYVMSLLYLEEASILQRESHDPPEAENSIYVNLEELFDLVTEKSQFVRDYRNVIGESFCWNYGDIRGKADQIRALMTAANKTGPCGVRGFG